MKKMKIEKGVYPGFDFPKEWNKTVVVFTRHELDPQQKENMIEFETDHGILSITFWDAKEEASQILKDYDDAEEMLYNLLSLIEDKEVNIYGVIPTALRSVMFHSAEDSTSKTIDKVVTTFEALSTNRAEEGQKPQFQFQAWMMTGRYDLHIPKYGRREGV